MTLTLFAERDARSGLWQYRCLFSGSARYLARREVRSFSGSEGALRGGRNRLSPQRDRTHERILYRARSRQHRLPPPPPSPPTNRISIPCASRGPFLFRLCSIVFTLRGPLLFRLCSIVFTLRGPLLFRLCSIVFTLRGPLLFRLCFVVPLGLNLIRRL